MEKAEGRQDEESAEDCMKSIGSFVGTAMLWLAAIALIFYALLRWNLRSQTRVLQEQQRVTESRMSELLALGNALQVETQRLRLAATAVETAANSHWVQIGILTTEWEQVRTYFERTRNPDRERIYRLERLVQQMLYPTDE